MASLRKRAGPEIEADQQQQHDADNAQRRLIDVPAVRQLHHACGKNYPTQQNVAQPVGGDAEGEDAGDSGAGQAKARVKAIAHADAAHPGTQGQVKGVADKRHQHHLTLGQLMTAVDPS
ncbi:hypothetical protein D3C75_1129340 [compost metagenome]